MSFQASLNDENANSFSATIKKYLLICLLTIAGVDYERLKDAPKSERVVYPALGILMCLAAAWTGFGLTVKLKVGLELGMLSTIAAFIFTTMFALLLEMVVVGTLKNGAKFLGNLAVRMILGFNLMLLQVVPVLVIVFSPNIQVYKNEQVIQKTLAAKEAASKSTDLTSLTNLNQSAQERFRKAKENRMNPPENMLLTETTKLLEEKTIELTESETKLEQQQILVNTAKNRLNGIAKTEENKKAIANAQYKYNLAQAKFNEMNTAVENLKQERDTIQAKKEQIFNEYDAYLTKELNEATAAMNTQSAKLQNAMNEVQKVTQETQNLAQQATTSRFFNDVSSLIEIVKVNESILYTSLFVIFIALLIDLMPILTKMQLSKGVYAKLVNDEEEISKALAELKKTQILSDVEKKRMEYEKLHVTLEQERLQLQEMKSEILSKKFDNEKVLKNIIKNQKRENSFFGKLFGGKQTTKNTVKSSSNEIKKEEINEAQPFVDENPLFVKEPKSE